MQPPKHSKTEIYETHILYICLHQRLYVIYPSAGPLVKLADEQYIKKKNTHTHTHFKKKTR